MVSNENTGVDILVTVGKVALERGWYDQAREYFEQALDLAPSNREALDGLVQAILSDRTITTVEPIQDGPVEPLHKVERKPKPPHHQESENESEIRGVSLLPIAEMQDQSSPPIEVLNLSIRSYNCLQRSDLRTVAQVATLSDEELSAIRQLGPKPLAEVREKLAAYLSEHPLPNETEQSHPEPETQTVEPLPPQPPSPPPDPTPLDVLGLSIRPYNALMRNDITTIGQLARMSDEEIKGVRNVGPKSLAEIREKLQVYFSAMPTLATKVPKASAQDESPSGTPLSELDMPREVQEDLQAVGIQSIEEAISYSKEELLLQLDIGYYSVIVLERGLSQRGLALSTKPLLQPMVDSNTLTALNQRGVPFDEISIARLALPEGWEETLRRTGFDNVQELATASQYVLEVACFPWRPDRVSKIKLHLNRYLTWLVEQQDETAWADEVAGRGISPLYRLELAETSLETLVEKWFSPLKDRERQVIRWRYGLDGEELSLEGVGDRLDLTRERVRQIQRRALKLLVHPVHRRTIKAFVEFLQYVFIQSGGLLTKEQIAEIVESSMGIGDIDCCRAICLVMDIDGRFVNLKKERVWGLDSYPLKHVSGVNRLLEKPLKAAYAPLSKADLLARLKKSKLFKQNREELIDEFLVACLNTNSNMEILDGEYYGLKKWARTRIDEMVMVLRVLGRPAHYTEIARLTNELLPASMRASDHVILAQLQRESAVFVRVERGTYGLKEWGLERLPYYADIIAEVLEGEGHPLPAGEILKRVEEIRPAKESTVMMTLTMHPRFRQVDGETYGLRSWRLPGEDVEERPLPPGFLEDMKHHIFQELVE